MPGNEQARIAVQEALAATLNFSPADLEANRLGQVTEEQLRHVPRKLVTQGHLTVRQVSGEIRTQRQYQSGDDGPGRSVYILEGDGHAFQVPSQAVLNACAQRGRAIACIIWRRPISC